MGRDVDKETEECGIRRKAKATMALAVKVNYNDGAQARVATLRDLSSSTTLNLFATEIQSRFGVEPEHQHSKLHA